MKKIEDQSWWGELLAVKDTLSLRQLADRFGVSPAAISNALKRNGIGRKASPSGPRKKTSTSDPSPVRPRGRQSKLDRFADQMGKVVDREIAAKAGVTVSAVTNYRRRNNIKAAARRGRPRVRPVNQTGGDEGVARAAKGYRVEVDGESFVVVAPDIVSAAASAAETGRGEVTQVELIGPVLLAP